MSRIPSSRYSGRIGLSFLMWMIAFAIISSACGVTYAYYKNRQVAVKTDINRLEREIAICHMSANQYRAKINAQTNRWFMRGRLKSNNSALRPIARGQIEFARSEQDLARLRTAAAH
ncbi:MAG: hypothetical protein IKZ07_01645 [Akkermansia sp.]|nr:hypothetical protein [Akkermansia sp.]